MNFLFSQFPALEKKISHVPLRLIRKKFISDPSRTIKREVRIQNRWSKGLYKLLKNGGRILKSGMSFMKMFRSRTSLLSKGGILKSGFQWWKEADQVQKISIGGGLPGKSRTQPLHFNSFFQEEIVVMLKQGTLQEGRLKKIPGWLRWKSEKQSG